MADRKKPLGADHTGEVWENREITGPGRMKVELRTKRDADGPRHYEYRIQLWRWRCRVCGATGETTYGFIARTGHKCKLTQPADGQRDEPYVCTEQCRGCGHYRTISGNEHSRCCHYSIDTGHRRPKADLRTEPCPVREPGYKAPRPAPEMILPGTQLLQRIMEHSD